jgi:hypothetical protein
MNAAGLIIAGNHIINRHVQIDMRPQFGTAVSAAYVAAETFRWRERRLPVAIRGKVIRH